MNICRASRLHRRTKLFWFPGIFRRCEKLNCIAAKYVCENCYVQESILQCSWMLHKTFEQIRDFQSLMGLFPKMFITIRATLLAIQLSFIRKNPVAIQNILRCFFTIKHMYCRIYIVVKVCLYRIDSNILWKNVFNLFSQ